MYVTNPTHYAGIPGSPRLHVGPYRMHGLSPRPWTVNESVEEDLVGLTQSTWQEKGDQAPGLLLEAPTCLSSCRRWIEWAAGECPRAIGSNWEALPRGPAAGGRGWPLQLGWKHLPFLSLFLYFSAAFAASPPLRSLAGSLPPPPPPLLSLKSSLC